MSMLGPIWPWFGTTHYHIINGTLLGHGGCQCMQISWSNE